MCFVYTAQCTLSQCTPKKKKKRQIIGKNGKSQAFRMPHSLHSIKVQSWCSKMKNNYNFRRWANKLICFIPCVRTTINAINCQMTSTNDDVFISICVAIEIPIFSQKQNKRDIGRNKNKKKQNKKETMCRLPLSTTRNETVLVCYVQFP